MIQEIEEMIEEVDWDGNTIAVHPKSYMKQRMFLHKASLVIPKTEDGKFLISMRAADKHPWPSTWVCAIGGKASQGETFDQAAKRESEEEVGRALDVEHVTEFKYDDDKYKAIFNVYTTKDPVDPDSLEPDPGEIQYFKAVTLEELSRSIKDDPDAFAPTFRAAVRAFVAALENKGQ